MGSFFSQMNTMRQAMAASICEIAFMLVLSGKPNIPRKIAGAIVILIATTIHTVAFIAYIPYILILFTKGEEAETSYTAQKILLRSIGLAIVGFVGYSIVMRIAVRLFPAYTYYFLSVWGESNYNASLFNTLIAVVFAAAGGIVLKTATLNNIQRFATIMIGFSIVFYVLSMRMEIWNRIAGIFSIYTYLLWVPEFVSDISDLKNSIIVRLSIVIAAFFYMVIVLYFRPEWTLVVPYALRG